MLIIYFSKQAQFQSTQRATRIRDGTLRVLEKVSSQANGNFCLLKPTQKIQNQLNILIPQTRVTQTLYVSNIFIPIIASVCRAMQKIKQFRRLKLEEVKVLAEEGFELNAAEYQQQVEKREAQRRQEREERLAREAMMTLKAMEQEEQRAAETAAKEAETVTVQGKDNGDSDKLYLFL